MNEATMKRLDRLHNRPTKYELAITHPNGSSYLIRYTNRRNRTGMWDCLYQVAQAITDLTGTDYVDPAWLVKDGATVGEWTIHFTGRTQRDAIINGELEFIEDIKA